jgi:hypothetical protein
MYPSYLHGWLFFFLGDCRLHPLRRHSVMITKQPHNNHNIATTQPPKQPEPSIMVSTCSNDLIIDNHQFDGQLAAAANTITQTQASPTPYSQNDHNLTFNSPNEAIPVRDIRTRCRDNEFTDEDVKKCHTKPPTNIELSRDWVRV